MLFVGHGRWGVLEFSFDFVFSLRIASFLANRLSCCHVPNNAKKTVFLKNYHSLRLVVKGTETERQYFVD